jgi:small subunit ribosomal protein S7
MSRRSQAPRRHVLPDPKYGNEMLAKFINMVMRSGKKSVAEQIVYGALDRISDRVTKDVPVEVRSTRRETLAMRWAIDAARNRSEKTMALRLAHELMDAADNRGAAVKKREDTHRMAEANKAFAHYRW